MPIFLYKNYACHHCGASKFWKSPVESKTCIPSIFCTSYISLQFNEILERTTKSGSSQRCHCRQYSGNHKEKYTSRCIMLCRLRFSTILVSCTLNLGIISQVSGLGLFPFDFILA